MVEKKVSEILAARVAAEKDAQPPPPVQPEISEAVQKRLEALERRIDSEEWRDDAKSDGLRFLLAARQHKERGEDAAALKMYEMALPFFPGQAKLISKIERLRTRLNGGAHSGSEHRESPRRKRRPVYDDADGDYETAEADVDEEEGARTKSKSRKLKVKALNTKSLLSGDDEGPASPRTQQLLDIVNSRDLTQIRSLVGFGAKKARDLVDYLDLVDGDEAGGRIESLAQLRTVPGMGSRTVERAYEGLVA
jgi:DNA uptake protein ComE-like DNA-binding protein